jgi:hypothetical protein
MRCTSPWVEGGMGQNLMSIDYTCANSIFFLKRKDKGEEKKKTKAKQKGGRRIRRK